MTENIDVVILAKNSEKTLEYCCKAVLTRIPVNNLIIVVGKSVDKTLEVAEKYAHLVIEEETNTIGSARDLGLKHVETKFYASIDSDVIISPEWYNWCIKTICENPSVGACEGYVKPFGHHYYDFQYSLKDKGYCSLGNTLLRTKLIKEVGMPHEPYEEDMYLRERIERRNYNWAVNFDVVSTHLVNDVDIFRHYIYFGKHEKCSLVTLLKTLVLSFRDFINSKNAGINLRIYLLLLKMSRFYGLISGKRIQTFSD